jgi:hypothetical protein
LDWVVLVVQQVSKVQVRKLAAQELLQLLLLAAVLERTITALETNQAVMVDQAAEQEIQRQILVQEILQLPHPRKEIMAVLVLVKVQAAAVEQVQLAKLHLLAAKLGQVVLAVHLL